MSAPLLKTWLNRFIAEHQESFPGARWPAAMSEPGRKLWGEWFDQFKAGHVTEDEARAASTMLDQPELGCQEHPRVVVAIVEANRDAKSQAHAPAPPSVPADCMRCGGSGMVTVYHPKYAGKGVVEIEAPGPGGEIRKVRQPGHVAAHCGCPMGRWLRSKVDVEVSRRIPDLLDVLEGKSRWLAEDPTMPGAIEPPEGMTDYHKLWHYLAAKLCEGEGGGVVQVRDGRVVR